MASNAVFLEAITLQLARKLKFAGAEEQFFEILLEGEGAPRIREAVQWNPDRVEELVASGRWRPSDLKEWKWLSVMALWGELQARMPRSLELGMALENSPTRYMGAGLLFTQDEPLHDLLAEGFHHDDANNRAYSALAVSANGLPDYVGPLRAMIGDPHPWARANALASLVRLDDAQGTDRAREVFEGRSSPTRSELVPYLFEALDRAAPAPPVIAFLRSLQQDPETELTAQELAAVDSILILHGAENDRSRVRAGLLTIEPMAPQLPRSVRALAMAPDPEDIALLTELFHRQNTQTVALELVVALALAGSDEAEPLLRSAAFRLPWNQGLLAAGAARVAYGDDALTRWIRIAPEDTPPETIRRLGYALGVFGGEDSLKRLRESFGNGESASAVTAARATAALQGAALGALSATAPE